MNNQIELLFGGDFYIDESYTSKRMFSDKIIDIFQNSNFNCINFESPIINDPNLNKIIKTGPHIYTNPSIIKNLKEININLVSLSNNHIRDYGDDGIKSTLDIMKKNNINTIGAGKNLEDAQKPYIYNNNDLKIGMLNFCENEWSVATKNSYGSNPLNIIDNYKQIRELKKRVDYVIVIIHGGYEYYNLPSPRMKKIYRFFADIGADLIIGHHTHCISGFEVYNDVPIIYSIGNFLFTKQSKYDNWYIGLLLKLNISKEKLNWEIIPIKQNKNNFIVSILEDEQKINVVNQINKYSKIINDNKLLEDNWKYFIDKKNKEEIGLFSPINVINNTRIKKILRKFNFEKYFERKKRYITILNHLRCESHLDVTLDILKKKVYEE